MLCDLRNLQALSVVQGTPDKLHYFSFKVLLYLFVVLLIIIFVRLLKYWNIHFKLVKSRRILCLLICGSLASHPNLLVSYL